MSKREFLEEIKIGIADIILSLRGQVLGGELAIDSVYGQFMSNGTPEVLLRVYYGKIPNRNLEEKVFDSGTTWSSYRCKGKYILQDCSLEPPSSPQTLMVIEPDFRSGEIYMSNDDSLHSPSYAMRHPLDQVLLINLLSLGRGVLFHACGINDKGYGYLFPGNSTHGKSTMARIWSEDGTTVLNDDRIVVRRKDGRFWIYGTPWFGDAKTCSPEKASLEKIFFLKHARKNMLKKLNSLDAVSRLIVCSFPTLWDKKGMEFTLKFCAELAQRIPCYELGFVPDESVLDVVRGLRI